MLHTYLHLNSQFQVNIGLVIPFSLGFLPLHALEENCWLSMGWSVKALKGIKSTDLNQWLCLVLPSSTTTPAKRDTAPFTVPKV